MVNPPYFRDKSSRKHVKKTEVILQQGLLEKSWENQQKLHILFSSIISWVKTDQKEKWLAGEKATACSDKKRGENILLQEST